MLNVEKNFKIVYLNWRSSVWVKRIWGPNAAYSLQTVSCYFINLTPDNSINTQLYKNNMQ